MIHLHRIIGDILNIVNSVRNADSWRSAAATGKTEELQQRVKKANDALQTWAGDMVPPHLKRAREGKPLAQKHIVLSSFFSAVMLLHRAFIGNPHRQSPLAGSQAQLKSAKAATDCIQGTVAFFQSVPRSHFTIFHGQYVFVSALILLACIRRSEDPKFIFGALRDVELATTALQGLEGFWNGAKKCGATVKEYLDFTYDVLQGDRRCHFNCDQHQPHNAREHRTAKRSASRSSTKENGLKRRKPSDQTSLAANTPSHSIPTTTTSWPGRHGKNDLASASSSNIDRSVSVPTRHPSENYEETYFDNTIEAFLGAISPDFEFHDHFNRSLMSGFNPPAV